jgi:hypothetical protein
MFALVFLNLNAQIASLADRRNNNCIAVTPMQVGTLATFSVNVQNTGNTECDLATVEFFLKRPGDAHPVPLAANLCLPQANPVAPTVLQPGDTFDFTLRYTVQSGDVGSGMLYAQIQGPGVPPPGTDPSVITLAETFNAQCRVGVIGAAVGIGPAVSA